MTAIKLFRYSSSGTIELPGKAVAIEKTLQKLIESSDQYSVQRLEHIDSKVTA